MATVEWLTFSEMARKAAMTESEVRKIVRDFGHILCARQFGDIMKYPLEAVELISLIKRRAEEGWSLENLRSLITCIDRGHR